MRPCPRSPSLVITKTWQRQSWSFSVTVAGSSPAAVLVSTSRSYCRAAPQMRWGFGVIIFLGAALGSWRRRPSCASTSRRLAIGIRPQSLTPSVIGLRWGHSMFWAGVIRRMNEAIIGVTWTHRCNTRFAPEREGGFSPPLLVPVR
jgi:hypothetical protein